MVETAPTETLIQQYSYKEKGKLVDFSISFFPFFCNHMVASSVNIVDLIQPHN